MIASVFGAAFAPEGTLRRVESEDIVDGRIPEVLAGVCVLVGERRAAISLVTPAQINIIVPEISGASVPVQVVSDCGRPGEKRGNIRNVAVAAASPEFFYFLSRPDGRNPVAAILNATGERIGDPGMIPGVEFRRALPGDVITVFGTGFGATSPATIAGAIAATAAATSVKPAVQLGGVTLDEADVIYAGVSPSLAGVYQLSIRIPQNTPEGTQTLVIRFGSVASPPNAVIAVGR
jgi:uncharacterized protein (TIGR03437 family)